MLKVVKFGGSSMADAAQFQKVRDIVLQDEKRRIVVVSAPGKRFDGDNKVTDLLYLCHAHLQYGVNYESMFERIEERYNSIRDALGLHTDLEAEYAAIKEKMNADLAPDVLASRGEYLAAKLMADYLGFEFVDAADWLRFTMTGEIDRAESYAALRRIAEGKKCVIPGFYGACADGEIRVLSRGGSDVTGALAAAALDAEVYENWTDVSGILMADPRIVQDPRALEYVTYRELGELSYIGTQVLHEDAAAPVREKNIPINIRNTNRPQDAGTMICSEVPGDAQCSGITGIFGNQGRTMITVEKRNIHEDTEYFRKLFGVFSEARIPVLNFMCGAENVNLLVRIKRYGDTAALLNKRLAEEKLADRVDIKKDVSTIAIVSRMLREKPQISGRALSALGEAGISVCCMMQGQGGLSLTAAVSNDDYEPAIKALYREFVDGKGVKPL